MRLKTFTILDMGALLLQFIVFCVCCICIHAYRFTFPSRLLKANLRRNAISTETSHEALRKQQQELYRSAFNHDSYEYEYDGKVMMYTPDKNPSNTASSNSRFQSSELLTSYVASEGLESIITSRGVNKPLLPLEYEISFKLFPRLRQAVIDGIWQDRENMTENTANVIQSCIKATAPEIVRVPATEVNIPPIWQDIVAVGSIDDVYNVTEEDLVKLCEVLRQVTDSRNATLREDVLSQLGVPFQAHMTFLPTKLDESNGEPDYEADELHFDFFTLGLEFLSHLCRCTSIQSSLVPQDDRITYYVQDALLRIFRMVVVVLKSSPLPGERVYFSYGSFTALKKEGILCAFLNSC